MTMNMRALPAAVLLVLIGATTVAPPATATSPSACFAVNPTSGSLSTTFGVDASCSTHPTTPATLLEVRWDWEDDGVWDTLFAVVKTATHQYTSVGSYDIRVEVRDPVSGDTATTTRNVVVLPNAYVTAWGAIRITAGPGGASHAESFTWLGWSCSGGATPTGYEVSCIPPAPPTGFDGWQCNGLAIWGTAGLGGSVRGTLGCEDVNGNTADTGTGGIVGPNSSSGAGVPQIVDIVRLYCRADGVFPLPAAQQPYTVACGDP